MHLQTLKGMAATNGRLACPVIACETAGAASHAASLKASYDAGGELTMARLDAITTIASTLGATQVSSESIERALQHEGGVVSVVMEDARAVDAVRRLTSQCYPLLRLRRSIQAVELTSCLRFFDSR